MSCEKGKIPAISNMLSVSQPRSCEVISPANHNTHSNHMVFVAIVMLANQKTFLYMNIQ